jgi:hypothetical protein
MFSSFLTAFWKGRVEEEEEEAAAFNEEDGKKLF